MFYKNLEGIYLFATQKDKCQEKIWQKGVEFRLRLQLRQPLWSRTRAELLHIHPMYGYGTAFGRYAGLDRIYGDVSRSDLPDYPECVFHFSPPLSLRT